MAFSAPNYTQVPNQILDELLPVLKESELKVLLVIVRQTIGWRKEADYISISQMMKKTGLQKEATCNACKSLIEKDHIEKVTVGEFGQQKTFYRLKIQENYTGTEFEPPPVGIRTPPGSKFEHTKETLTKNTKTKEYIYSPKSESPSNCSLESLPTKNPEPVEADASSFAADASRISLLLLNSIKKRNAAFKEPNLSKWDSEAEKMLRLDKRAVCDVLEVIDWLPEDSFWQSTCLSTSSLRKNFDRLFMQMESSYKNDQIRKNKKYIIWLKLKHKDRTQEITYCSKYVSNLKLHKEISFDQPHEQFVEQIKCLFGEGHV